MFNLENMTQFFRYICGLENRYESQQLIPIKIQREDDDARRKAAAYSYARRRGLDDSR